MNISVLGPGRWGTFIAWYLNKIGNNVILWGREGSAKLEELQKNGKNKFLEIPEEIILTSSLDKAVEESKCIVIAIEAQNLADFMQILKKYDFENKIIVLCMKGLEEETGERLSIVTKRYLGEKTNVAVWVGPGHPKEFVRGNPNCMVIDSENREVVELLVRELSSDLIRFYYGDDIIGNEIGAASKNVIGIAAGMLDGLNLSSLKGALMTRGTKEVSNLIVAMGGKQITAFGLCCLGDYEATLFSKYSNNRRYGEAFIKKEKFEEHSAGAHTVKSLMKLSEKYNVKLPICTAVYNILYNGSEPEKTLKQLFDRPNVTEF